MEDVVKVVEFCIDMQQFVPLLLQMLLSQDNSS